SHLSELASALAAQKSRSQEVEQRVQTLQEDMTKAVDHHASLSRSLVEAKMRERELLHEAVRLQAVLQDLTREQRAPEEPPQRRAPEAAAE
ncbi:rpl-27a, partial [Symbiodinium microadriaticum]